jgi:hypothetical protein
MAKEYDADYHLAILARDIIDMAREYSDDTNALECISSMCFSLFMIYENNSTIDWHELFSTYDQRYYRLQNNSSSNPETPSIELIRSKAMEIINMSIEA